MEVIWDEAFLKQHERNLREDALAVQSDEDWERAVLRLERGMSDISDGFLGCWLPACRRAHRCVGNKPICMPRCKVELVPGGEQESRSFMPTSSGSAAMPRRRTARRAWGAL
jgi:hypothetical protein